MDRRNFIKSGLLTAAIGAAAGSKGMAQELQKPVSKEFLPEGILNYNPQMQYRPMGRTDVQVSDCTGCYQCIPCPHNVAIGYIFAYVYNNYILYKNKDRVMSDYTVSMSPVQRGDPASSCVGCGECLAKCLQHLDIPNLLAKVKEVMRK